MIFRDDLKITFKVGYRRYDTCIDLVEESYDIATNINLCIEHNNINDFSEVYVSYRGVTHRLSCININHFKVMFNVLICNCYKDYLNGDKPFSYLTCEDVDSSLLQETTKSLPICCNVSKVRISITDSFANPIDMSVFDDEVIERTVNQLKTYNPISNGVIRFYITDEGIDKIYDVSFYSIEGFYRAVYDVMTYLCNCSKVSQSRYSSLKSVFYNTSEVDVLEYFLKDNKCIGVSPFLSAINKMNR